MSIVAWIHICIFIPPLQVEFGVLRLPTGNMSSLACYYIMTALGLTRLSDHPDEACNKDEALVGEQIYLFHTLATCYLFVLLICSYGKDVSIFSDKYKSFYDLGGKKA